MIIMKKLITICVFIVTVFTVNAQQKSDSIGSSYKVTKLFSTDLKKRNKTETLFILKCNSK